MSIESTISNFVHQHSLPSSYRLSAEKYYLPLATKLAKQSSGRNAPLLVGIHGCQGSGKSTLTDFLVYVLKHEFNVVAVGMSIDDFYRTKEERTLLAKSTHPLFATRGVPGTHDTEMLAKVLESFQGDSYPITIPRFDKSIDDRFPESKSTIISAKPDLVFLEGWCVGSVPSSSISLEQPINALEANEDSDASWRQYSNDQLAGEYQQIFSKLERMIMLKAPGFFTVKQWRHEQEVRLKEKLVAQGAPTDQLMDEASIERFIQHYERITSHSLQTIPDFANDVFELDENRMIHNHVERGNS